MKNEPDHSRRSILHSSFEIRNSKFLSVLGMTLVLIACGANTSPPPTPRPAPTAARVVFPDGYAVHVEIAADEDTRRQGLMYRDRLPADGGMLFFFPQNGDYPFWMKNTLIPLDLIWIDDQRRIAAIAHDVPPCKGDPCPSVPPNAQARYVLEVAAGVAARHRLAKGQTLRFEGLDNVIIR
jgi:uncharacterized membrane protein (UPF0127 family)